MRSHEGKNSFSSINRIMRGTKLILNERGCKIKMGRLNPDERSLASKMRRQGVPLKFIVEAFSCSRQTIWFWAKQDLRTRFDIDKNGKGKITKC